MRRREFVKGCAALAALPLVARAAPLTEVGIGPGDPTDWPVSRLRQALDTGTLTAGDLMSALLLKVERIDSVLHSIIEINPEALEIATRWDADPTRGPLAGIPVLLKDNIATADRMVTSAGSAALATSRYPVDSGVARRLRESGAILLGKANMSEWANYRSDNSTSGWSARGGQCHNPHVLDRSPCGSSSGSAAAVSAGLAPLAVGTETVGSIVCPSGTCGIVGLKPTFGLLPDDGIIPIATSWDTAGPMGRSVADVALLLGAMARKPQDFTENLRAGGLKGARIGVARQFFGFDSRVDQLVEEQMKVLEKLGAVLVDPVKVPAWKDMSEPLDVVMRYEFKAGLNAYLAKQTPDQQVRTLADVITFNRENADLEALSYLGQSVLEKAQASGPLSDPAYRTALADIRRIVVEEGLEKTFKSDNLDAVLGPTNGPAWTIDLVNGDHYEGGSAAPAAVGGYPHVTVPAGFIHELPVGISLFGPKWSEGKLISYAFEYEQATHHFRAPGLLTTLD